MQTNEMSLLVCPDCSSPLEQCEGWGTVCRSCEIGFPIVDGIHVLLPRQSRNRDLELPLIERALRETRGSAYERFFAKAAAVVRDLPSGKSWEWEDEEFWAKEYSHLSSVAEEKNWNDRLWEREFLRENALRRLEGLSGKIVLDVGCGEGQTFRRVLVSYADDTTTYVGADISLSALKLNRTRNPCRNGIYVLCSANRLPFRERTMDMICYFGILHHTERKSETLREDARLLRTGGVMVLHEVLARPTITEMFGLPSEESSAHDDEVDREELRRTIDATPSLGVVAKREMHSPFYSAAIRFAQPVVLARRSMWEVVRLIDAGVIRLLGSWIPLFRSAAVLMVLQKK